MDSYCSVCLGRPANPFVFRIRSSHLLYLTGLYEHCAVAGSEHRCMTASNM